MGFFKKPKSRNIPLKDEICLIKAFKIIDRPETIDIKTCFDVMLDVFVSRGHETFQIMGRLTAGEGFDFTKLKPFYTLLHKQNVSDFSAYFDDDYDLGIHYWTIPLNPESESDQERLVEFFIAIPYEWYCLDQTREIITKLDTAIGIHYAYVSFVPRDYCVDLERQLEAWERPSGNGLFEPLHTEIPHYNGFNMKKVQAALDAQQEELDARNAIAERGMEEVNAEKLERLRHIASGYIPKCHPVNFYNKRQLQNLKENKDDKFEKISDNLTMVTYLNKQTTV
jgi:hypothetical protein